MRYRFVTDRLTRGLAIVLAVMLLTLVSAHSAQTDTPSCENTFHRKSLLKTVIVDNYYPYTFMNPDGQECRAMMVDITARKQAREALHKAYDE
jgi:hypothetical protein